jgi:hypothetical protein
MTRLILALALCLSCDATGLTVETPDAGPCQSWGLVDDGPNQGQRICLDGTPSDPATSCSPNEVAMCSCAGGGVGHRTCVDGKLSPCACEAP